MAPTRRTRGSNAQAPESVEPTGHIVTLVPIAAVLGASIRLHFLDGLLHLGHRRPNLIACDAPYRKGEEMGGFELCEDVRERSVVRMGEPLMRVP